MITQFLALQIAHFESLHNVLTGKKEPYFTKQHIKNFLLLCLPSSVSRGGDLLLLRRALDPERRCLRRMSTGEWLGSLFHLSRLSNERLRNTGRLPRPLDLDLRLRSEERERDLDLRLLSTDLFLLPVDRLLDRLLLSVDLDLLLPLAVVERLRDRLFLVGDRDLDLRGLVRDLEWERLCRVAERERLVFRRRPGLRDFERRFFFSDGETDFFFFAGDLDLKKESQVNKHAALIMHSGEKKSLHWLQIPLLMFFINTKRKCIYCKESCQ